MSDELIRKVAAAICNDGPGSLYVWLPHAERVLAVEVSPGVTLGDAARAYVALERAAYNDRDGGDVPVWCSSGVWHVAIGSAFSTRRNTLAAAILAATEAPDAG